MARSGGDFHSDELHVVERYTPTTPYHLMYEATMEDPKVYTRPWKTVFRSIAGWKKNVQLLEFKCVPFTRGAAVQSFWQADGEVSG